MADRFRITLAQLNPTVGDIAGNAAKARTAWEEGRKAGAQLVALPEMFLTGYNTQDLVMKPVFHRAAMAAAEQLAQDCADGPALAIGAPWAEGGKLYNAYLILKDGRIASRILKHHLPNETVFDEVRVFDAGPLGGPYAIDDTRIGSPICEDGWHEDVAETLAETGAEFLLIPNGSPYFRGKMEVRYNMMVARCIETHLPVIYLNMVGGQDDQIFDGGSFVLNPGGALALQMPLYDEAVTQLDLERTDEGWRAVEGEKAHFPDEWEQDYRAMVESLRDYMAKTGFKKALLGLSGGVDSAIVAAIAVDAIGAENVRCVMLPSEYTSAESLEDAEAVANLPVPWRGYAPAPRANGSPLPADLRRGCRLLGDSASPLWRSRSVDQRLGDRTDRLCRSARALHAEYWPRRTIGLLAQTGRAGASCRRRHCRLAIEWRVDQSASLDQCLVAQPLCLSAPRRLIPAGCRVRHPGLRDARAADIDRANDGT